MYADRKGWPLEGVDVQLSYTVKGRRGNLVDRPVDHPARPLGDDQRTRLAEIAEKTPVTRAVRAGTEIRSTVERA